MSTALKVIIDTDPGIDDAMALKLAASCGQLDIVAVTTCFGNADIDTTTRNARLLCRRFGITAPVHRGASSPLHITRHPSPTHVHGHDGLGDVGDYGDDLVAMLPPGELSPVSAAQAICAAVRAAPGQITLIALAPLTNLAAALELDPGIAEHVREVIVMGGALGGNACNGNVTPWAEANAWNDPHAAQQVLGASWPLVLVPLDVTTQCVLTAEMSGLAADDATGDAAFLHRISRRYDALYREVDGLAGCCLHDVAAVACALDRSLFATRAGRFEVTVAGEMAGRVQFTAAGDSSPLRASVPHRYCHQVDAARLLALYCDALASRGDAS